MADDAQRARVIALLTESVDLFAAVTAVCRALPDERAFTASVLKLDVAALDEIEARWRERLARDPGLEATFHTQTREYEWSFRHLRAGAMPVVVP